jgi:uncharacterized protein
MRPSLFAVALALVVSSALPACSINASQTDDSEEVTEAEDELTLTTGKFETFTGRDGKVYFHLLAGNGEKMLRSEAYASGAAAVNAISVMQAGVTYELRTAKSGEVYFVTKSANGAILGTSETYATKSNAERAIETTKKIISRTTSVLAAPSGAVFQVIKSLNGGYFFHLRANNGEIVLQSQSYTARASAVNGVQSVKAFGRAVTSFELREAANGQWYFVLKASNGQVIANGETYASKWNAERGVATVVELLQ